MDYNSKSSLVRILTPYSLIIMVLLGEIYIENNFDIRYKNLK
jgi:hypothetical protein